MTDFDFNESNAGCLDNETNKETLRKHILDSFNEAYTVNGAVLLDAGIYLNSLSFFNLLGIKTYDIYHYLRRMYVCGLWKTLSAKFNVSIDPFKGPITNLNVCAGEFTSELDLNQLKAMYENAKDYANEFVKFAEKHDVANELHPTEEEKNTDDLKQYSVDLEIGYHRDYTITNITNRVNGRLHYKWDEVEASIANVYRMEDNTFKVHINFLAEDAPLCQIEDKIKFRFGATSGKPWKRCKVIGVYLS